MKQFYWLILSCALFLSQSVVAQKRRSTIGDGKPGNTIRQLSFFSPKEGWVAAQGWIAFTADSGKTYSQRFIRPENVHLGLHNPNQQHGFRVEGVKALSRDTVLVYGDYSWQGAILYSTDAGNTFNLVWLDNTVSEGSTIPRVSDICFLSDKLYGLALTGEQCLYTEDGGLTWQKLTTYGLLPYGTKFQFVNDDFIISFATKERLNLIEQRNNTSIMISPPAPADAFWFRDRNFGYIYTYNKFRDRGLIYVTTDGGRSWKAMQAPYSGAPRLEKMQFINDSTGYAIGDDYSILTTTDSGKVWRRMAPAVTSVDAAGSGHNDLIVLPEGTVIAGGDNGIIEFDDRTSLNDLPYAAFRIDTVGFDAEHKVHLLNNTGNMEGVVFEWQVNGKVIGDGFDEIYQRNGSVIRDTVMLIAKKGSYSDTATQYFLFRGRLVIDHISAMVAEKGSIVYLTGKAMEDVKSVYFGGVEGKILFRQLVTNGSRLHVQVGNGASGPITVNSKLGTAFIPGFRIINPSGSSFLPFSLAPLYHCKAGAVSVEVRNTDAQYIYQLTDSIGNTFGEIAGNNGTVAFKSLPLSRSGSYRIRAYHPDAPDMYWDMTEPIIVEVEKTYAAYVTDKLNPLPGEQIRFFEQSKNAANLQWQFHGDASVASFNGRVPPPVSYATPGKKMVSMTAISASGCRDTILTSAVTVDMIRGGEDVCYSLPFSPGFSTSTSTSTYPNLIPTGHGFYFATDYLERPCELSSRYGRRVTTRGNTGYAGLYDASGELKWYAQCTGSITSAAQDMQGNIYLLGSFMKKGVLYIMEHDSIVLSPTVGNISEWSAFGYIVKINTAGKVVWLNYMQDPSGGSGYPRQLAINESEIVIYGNSNYGFTYFENGVAKSCFNFQANNDKVYYDILLKLNTDGRMKWYSYWKYKSLTGLKEVTGMEIDKAGNVTVAGAFENMLEIYQGNSSTLFSRMENPENRRSGFVVRYNTEGQVIWSNSFKDIISGHNGAYRAFIRGVAYSEDGKWLYLAGHTSQAIDNNYDIRQEIRHSDGTIINIEDGTTAYKVYKLDATTGKYVWHNGVKQPNNGTCAGVVVLGDRIFAAGYMQNLSKQPMVCEFTSVDKQHIIREIDPMKLIVAEYTPEGNLKRVESSGSNPYVNVEPYRMLGDGKGNMLFHLIYGSPGAPRSTDTVYNSTMQPTGHSILKTNGDLCLEGGFPGASAGPDLSLCALDSVLIGLPGQAGNRYRWTSSLPGFASALSQPRVKAENAAYYLTVTGPSGIVSYDTMQVFVPVRPHLGRDTSVCIGTSLKLGLPPDPGATFQWASDDGTVNAAFSEIEVRPLTSTTYILTTNNLGGCTGTAADTIHIKVKDAHMPVVTLAATDSMQCFTSRVRLVAKTMYAAPGTEFHWYRNGEHDAVSSDSIITLFHTSGSARFRVKIITNSACGQSIEAWSNEIQTRLYPEPGKSDARIVVTNAGPCVADTFRATVHIENERNHTRVHWQLGNNYIGEGRVVELPVNQPANSNALSVAVVMSDMCTDTIIRDTIDISEYSGYNYPHTVSIAASKEKVCYMEPVTFTATHTSSNYPLLYQWIRDYKMVGENSPVYTSTGEKSSYNIYVKVTELTPCGPIQKGSNTIFVNVEHFDPIVQLVINEDKLCKDQPAEFHAFVTEGARKPVYEWRKNGVLVGGNNPAYTDPKPANGDTYQVTFYDADRCYIVKGESEARTLSVAAVAKPVATITGNTTVFMGDYAEITAHNTDGVEVYGYQWYTSPERGDWKIIPGENRRTIKFVPENNGDKVRCWVLGVPQCPAELMSNELAFQVKQGDNSRIVQLFPSPASTNITLRVLSGNWTRFYITDVTGMRVLERKIEGINVMNVDISQLQNGNYNGVFINADGSKKEIKFTKIKQ